MPTRREIKTLIFKSRSLLILEDFLRTIPHLPEEREKLVALIETVATLKKIDNGRTVILHKKPNGMESIS